MRTEEQKAQMEAQRLENEERNRQHAAKDFGLADNEVLWYNGGICYSRVIVTTREAADKVAAQVKGRHVNGGYLHGMELGYIREYSRDGAIVYDVMV